MAKGYIVQAVSGDGEWREVSRHSTERAASGSAERAWQAHLRMYGQALRHIDTGRTVGSVRVVCPDGAVIPQDSLDLYR